MYEQVPMAEYTKDTKRDILDSFLKSFRNTKP